MLSHVELLARILVAAVLGGVIGWERDRHGKPVGLRTHTIVAMAAATFMVVSTEFVFLQHYSPNQLVRADPGRMAAAAVMGIGFVAGGAIFRTGVAVSGLTTAAGMWLVTGIGLASGAGMYVEALVVTVLGVVALTVLKRLEGHNAGRQRITVVTATAAALEPVAAAIKALGASVAAMSYDSQKDDGKGHVETVFDVQIAQTVTLARIASAIEEVQGVERVRIDVES